MKDKSLIMISGPSGVGKGKIIDLMLWLFFQDFYEKTDRYRKDRKELCIVRVYKTQSLGGGKAGQSVYGKSNSRNVYTFDCRGKEQEIDLDELDKSIENHNVTLIEAYYKTFNFLKNRYNKSIDFIPTFISPLDVNEIKELTRQGKTLENYLPELMFDSLIRRAERDGKAFTLALAKELKQRAEDSINEMRFAHNYKQVIPNYCYESDSRWNSPILIGEPRKVVSSLNDIVNISHSDYASSGHDFDFVM